MRGKKAKAIRRQAKAMTLAVNKAEKTPVVHEAYVELTRNRKKMEQVDKETGEKQLVEISIGTLMLHRTCGKRIYRLLKNTIKKEKNMKLFSSILEPSNTEPAAVAVQ